MTRKFSDLYRVLGDETYDAEFWNGFRRDVDDRIHALEELKLTVDGILGGLIRDAQATIQDVLDPAVLTIRKIQERGFLIASSSSAVTLSEGDELGWVITEGDTRDLFTPSTFTILSSATEPTDFAVLRTAGYDRVTGIYRAEVVTFSGSAGPHDDWEIGALAGPTLATLEYMVTAKAARDQAVPAAEAATQAAQTATDMRQSAAGHALNATNARDKAQKWANEVEDAEVEVGKYSGRHYAAKAAASALTAAAFDPAGYYTKTETRSRAEITAEIAAAIDALMAGAPGALDTLYELAAALGDDADFAATVNAAIAARLPLAGGVMTGTITFAAAQIATAANWRSGTAAKLLTADGIGAASAPVALADATTVAIDWSTFVTATLVMAGNRTLGNPTNVVAGTTRTIVIRSNSATERTPAYASNFKGPLPEETVTNTTVLRLALYAISATEIEVSWKVSEL